MKRNYWSAVKSFSGEEDPFSDRNPSKMAAEDPSFQPNFLLETKERKDILVSNTID